MQKGRIPSLDGARAMSIALVVASHLAWKPPTPLIWGFDYGNLGVRIFFVISGFLITKLLLEEQERNGRISVAQFYLRRAFRILPAAYVYVAIVCWLVVRNGHLRIGGMAPAVFYYADYQGWHYLGVTHFWSLSVEEQFYFLWPGALVFLGTLRARYACIALLFTAPLFRMLSAMGLWPTPPGSAFESVCDAIATGCLLALLRDGLWSNLKYRRVVENPLVWVIAGTGAVLTCTEFPIVVRWVIGIPLLNVGIAMILDRYMRLSRSTVVGRMLNFAPLVWIGTISYSLYLWQQLWLFSKMPILVKICGAMGSAVVSFYLVERPMLRLRRRIVGRLASARVPVRAVSTGNSG